MKPLLAPVLAHRVLDRRLHLEDQPAVGPAQVEVAPVDALVQRGVGRDRQLGLGRASRPRSSSSRSSRPPSFTRSSATTWPVTRDGRLGRERRDLLVERARRLVLAEHHLRQRRIRRARRGTARASGRARPAPSRARVTCSPTLLGSSPIRVRVIAGTLSERHRGGPRPRELDLDGELVGLGQLERSIDARRAAGRRAPAPAPPGARACRARRPARPARAS